MSLPPSNLFSPSRGFCINLGRGITINGPDGELPYEKVLFSQKYSSGTYECTLRLEYPKNDRRVVSNEPRRQVRYHPYRSNSRRSRSRDNYDDHSDDHYNSYSDDYSNDYSDDYSNDYSDDYYDRPRYRNYYTRSFACYTCWKKFRTMADMWAHKNDVHRRTYYCRICSKPYSTLQRVKEHQLTHEEHACQHCPETFKFKDSLTAHLSEAHKPKSPQCQCADKSADKAAKLTPVSAPVTSVSTPVTPVVTSVTPRASSVSDRPNDKNQAADKKAEKFNCTLCIKSFDTAEKLKNHLKIHTKEETGTPPEHPFKILTCPFCIKLFTAKRLLGLHMLSAHTAVYYCAKCTAEFESQAELNAHSRNHAVPS
ncbi:Hypothetical protein NTJ_06612 [Nesidiocoris tenuis]|uniref:C2H2-type domain-containing protein n=1 Tax=Nesidiocoris tenuis TaxID=355587 RepID=A0ABN7APA5_9HEMI|nr:Hypothetical protein NTJ_06612 [Nesidiocoris tenuis]